MGGKIACDCDQNVTPFIATAPLSILPYAGLEHLVGVEIRVVAQYGTSECGDQQVDRIAERQVTGNEAARLAHRSLAVESIQKCLTQCLAVGREGVEPVASFTGQPGGRE